MSDYPSAVYTPRTKENKAGVIYAPEETTKLFAEDVVKLDDEVVAIENELGESPKGAFADVAGRLSAIEGSIPADFKDLDDVPGAYTDQGGKIVAVNDEETALEFIDAPTGGGGYSLIDEFIINDVNQELKLSFIPKENLIIEFYGFNSSATATTMRIEFNDSYDYVYSSAISTNKNASAILNNTYRIQLSSVPSLSETFGKIEINNVIGRKKFIKANIMKDWSDFEIQDVNATFNKSEQISKVHFKLSFGDYLDVGGYIKVYGKD